MVELVRRPGPPPPPVAPAIRADSLRDPYWNAHAQTWVSTRSEHQRILREKGLIELGNEYDAWMSEVKNPDFDEEGRPVHVDRLSEADKRVYQENSEWLAKQTTRS